MKKRNISILAFATFLSLGGLVGCQPDAPELFLGLDTSNVTTKFRNGEKFTSKGLRVYTFKKDGNKRIDKKDTADYKVSYAEGTVLTEGEFTISVSSTKYKIDPATYKITVSPFTMYVDDPSVKLKLDFRKPDGTNRNFYTDGISEVTAYKYIDGDTTHFKMKGKQTIPEGCDEVVKTRYYGVDTPESTGRIEPWGKKASNFTKERLKECENGTIVVSSLREDYGIPETDSTGSRYVALIWISEKPNAKKEDLRLLNLWIVQEGLSKLKGIDKIPDYANTFQNAQRQAREFNLNVHKGVENDPDFNYGAPVPTSIFDLHEEALKLLKDPTAESKFNNQNVIIEGTVAGYVDSTLYVQAAEEAEDGSIRYASMNVYGGMSQIPYRFQQPNTYVRLPGKISYNETFGFQMASVEFPQVDQGSDKQAKVLKTPEEIIGTKYECKVFNEKAANIDENNHNLFQSPVGIQEVVTVTRAQQGKNDKTKFTLFIQPEGYSGRYPYAVRVNFIYKPYAHDPNASKLEKMVKFDTPEKWQGQKFHVKGIFSSFKFNDTDEAKFQICPRDDFDLEYIKPVAQD